jgi:hypothetical protein
LDISYTDNTIKCQGCNNKVSIPTVGLLVRSYSHSITLLERRIRWAEEHYPDAITAHAELKEELAALLKGQKKKELLRRLPLYSFSITGYKLVCSACFENAYNDNRKAKA